MVSICPHPHPHPPPQVEQDVVNLATAKVQFSEDSKVMIDVSLSRPPPLSGGGACAELVTGCLYHLEMGHV